MEETASELALESIAVTVFLNALAVAFGPKPVTFVNILKYAILVGDFSVIGVGPLFGRLAFVYVLHGLWIESWLLQLD